MVSLSQLKRAQLDDVARKLDIDPAAFSRASDLEEEILQTSTPDEIDQALEGIVDAPEVPDAAPETASIKIGDRVEMGGIFYRVIDVDESGSFVGRRDGTQERVSLTQ